MYPSFHKKTFAALFGLSLVALPCTALADFTFASTAVPTPAQELKKFFAGTSWLWGCKNCGAYYAPDGSYVALYTEQGETAIGRGTWSTKDGALCTEAERVKKDGTKETRNNCKDSLFGPGTDGSAPAKVALGLMKNSKKGYFWV